MRAKLGNAWVRTTSHRFGPARKRAECGDSGGLHDGIGGRDALGRTGEPPTVCDYGTVSGGDSLMMIGGTGYTAYPLPRRCLEHEGGHRRDVVTGNVFGTPLTVTAAPHGVGHESA
jgi:hypothetical protein